MLNPKTVVVNVMCIVCRLFDYKRLWLCRAFRL